MLKIIKETEKRDNEGDTNGHPTAASYTHEQKKGTGSTYRDGASVPFQGHKQQGCWGEAPAQQLAWPTSGCVISYIKCTFVHRRRVWRHRDWNYYIFVEMNTTRNNRMRQLSQAQWVMYHVLEFLGLASTDTQNHTCIDDMKVEERGPVLRKGRKMGREAYAQSSLDTWMRMVPC